MTEHIKALPRLRDELLGAMQASVMAAPHAIVCGLVVINAARSFISSENQRRFREGDPSSLRRNPHRQPDVVAKVIDRLQLRLPMRRDTSREGFDCFAFIVIEHDNEVPDPVVRLVTGPPAPSQMSPRNYDAFLIDVCNKYTERFGQR